MSQPNCQGFSNENNSDSNVIVNNKKKRNGKKKNNIVKVELLSTEQENKTQAEVVPHESNSETKKKQRRRKKKLETQEDLVRRVVQEITDSQERIKNETGIYSAVSNFGTKKRRDRRQGKVKAEESQLRSEVQEIDDTQAIRITNEAETYSNASLGAEKKLNGQEKKIQAQVKLQSSGESINVTPVTIADYCKNLPVNELNDPGILWMDKIMQDASTFDDQASLVISAVEADEKFYKGSDSLCKALETILRDKLLGISFSLETFGSVVTHLAFKDSDVDIFLDFGDSPKPENLQPLIKNAIKKNENFRRYMVRPIEAKVPIVKCVGLDASAISCDISFTSPFGLYKSHLLEFLISSDDRIRPIIMILKFWLKKQNLLEGNKISSFAIALLVIFSLQQCENPILPSVYSLQKNCSDKKIIDGWDVSFSKDNFTPASPNDLSAFDLLKFFFKFYGTFDYKSCVISPYLGKSLPIADFKNVENLPLEFELYKKYSKENPKENYDFSGAIHLQDPLIHNCNVTKNLTAKFCDQFSEQCLHALKICKEDEKRKSQKNYKCIFFKELFKPNKSFSYKLNPEFRIVEVFKIKQNDGLTKLKWADSVYKCLFEILTKVMKCKVEIGLKPFKRLKNTEKSQPKVYTCQMDFDLLSKKLRDEASSSLTDKGGPFLVKQEIISDFLCKNKFKGQQAKSARFQIVCFVKDDPIRIRFNLINLENRKGSKKNLVMKVFHSLEKILPEWIERSIKS